MMRAVGLIPSDTGEPGGKQTGQRMTHYIEEGGAFARACAALVEERGFEIPYVERWSEPEAVKGKAKADSKTRYTCLTCAIHIWAKPATPLVCGTCRAVLVEGA